MENVFGRVALGREQKGQHGNDEKAAPDAEKAGQDSHSGTENDVGGDPGHVLSLLDFSGFFSSRTRDFWMSSMCCFIFREARVAFRSARASRMSL